MGQRFELAATDSRNSIRARADKVKKAEFVAAEQEAAERPLREAIATQGKLLAELRDAKRQRIYTTVDEDLVLPQYAGKLSVEDVTRAVGAAFDAFRLWLSEQNITLTEQGVDCFLRLAELYGTADTTRAETFIKLYEYVDSLGGWTDRQVVKPQPAAEPEPEEPTVAVDFDNLNTVTNREQERLAKRITDKKFWRDASPLFQRWIESLREHWMFRPTEEQKRDAFNLITSLNLSPHDRRTYDVLRRAAVERGIFPAHILTNDEILSKELEEFRAKNPSASLRDERAWFVRRSNELKTRSLNSLAASETTIQ